MKQYKIYLLILFVMTCFAKSPQAQSPDSRVCYCFAEPVPDNFMQGTRALFGSSNVAVTRDLELRPQQLQPVSFQIPALPVTAKCRAVYTIYITDDQYKKVYESTGAVSTRSYSFPECNRTYHVTLMASGKSANGGDGNCTRQVIFKVTPQCAAATCNCGNDKNTKSAGSMDVNIAGRLECSTPSATQRRYVLKFDIVNKSECIIAVSSITVHGQTIDVPAFSTAPKSSTKGISLGFSTPLSQSAPAENNVSILVRYSIAGKKCSALMDIPFINCK
ncbi:MAG: hypothetical protein U0V75_03650 [Ferruginibacter sp.]